MSWDYADLQRHLDQLVEHKIKLGLERMKSICAHRGHPERGAPMVHIAGTNGKGSTIAFLAALLRDAGYRVGTYTSPHLRDFRERIAIDGEPAARDLLAHLGEQIAQQTAAMRLTYFEFATLLGFSYFAEQRPDIALIETGLGGRLDATNVVRPQLVILTAIAHDHEAWLGKTLPEIAGEKCGIIKPAVPVVSGPQHPEVAAVITATCSARGAPLHWAPPAPNAMLLGVAGAHQYDNAGIALTAAQLLAHSGGWRQGHSVALQRATWPGRCEWLRRDPPIVFDGAHNLAAAQSLAHYIRSTREQQHVVAYLGLANDKDAEAFIGALCPEVDEFVCLTLDSPRARPAQQLADCVAQHAKPSSVLPLADLNQRLRERTDAMQVVTGSFYLYDAIKV